MAYAAMLDEDAASFSEQAVLDAERGDTEAALYASCAAEFAAIIRDRALAYHAEIRLAVTASVIAIAHAGLHLAGVLHLPCDL